MVQPAEESNKKWQGLKLPVGKLFTPKQPIKPRVKRNGKAEEQSPAVGDTSQLTAETETLTESEGSPATTSQGKNTIFGRRRPLQGNDDSNSISAGTASTHTRRRSGGALEIIRKTMFSNSKENNYETPIEAPRDAREISESFRIDPYFDSNEFKATRRSSAKPPSLSDLSTSVETYSSRTENSPLSVKPPSLRKLADARNSVRSPRPMFTGARAALPAAFGLPLSDGNDQDGKSYDPTLSQKIKIGQEKMKIGSAMHAAKRSPKHTKPGLRNSQTGAHSTTIDDGSEASSFYPTLSQKIRIGKQEIERRLERRKSPQLDSQLNPTVTIDDCLPRIDKLEDSVPKTTSKSPESSTQASKTTVKMSNIAGSLHAPRTTARMSNMLGVVETPVPVSPESSPRSSTRRTSSSGQDRPSASPDARSSGHSRHSSRPHHGSDRSSDRRRNNPGFPARSRGRSGPRRRHEHGHGSPRKRTSRDPSTSLESNRSDDGAKEHESSLYSETRSRHRRSSKSTSNSRSSSRGTNHTDSNRDDPERRRARSYEPISPTTQPERTNPRHLPSEDGHQDKEKRRGGSYDSLSPTMQPERQNSRQRCDDARSYELSSSTKLPGRRDSGRSKDSPTHGERNRAESMDDSMSRQKRLERKASKSRHPSEDSRYHHQRYAQGEEGMEEGRSRSHTPSHHRRTTGRKYSRASKSSPRAVEGKRSKSMDDSMSKSSHVNSRHHPNGRKERDNEEKRARSHTPSYHQRRTERKSSKGNEGTSPRALERKGSRSMDESMSKSSLVTSRHNHSEMGEGEREEKRTRSHTPSQHYRRTERISSKGNEGSPRSQDRKRSKSMDDSISLSQNFDPKLNQSRESSHKCSPSNDKHQEEVEHRRHKAHGHSTHQRENRDHGQSRRSRHIPSPVGRIRSKSLDESLSSRASGHVERTHSISHGSVTPEFHDDSSVQMHSNSSLNESEIPEHPRPLERKLDRDPASGIASAHSSKESETSDKLWNQLAMSDALPVALTREEKRLEDRSQKVVSKAELARRDELLNEPTDCAPSRPRRKSRSPGKYGSHHDEEGTSSSRGTNSSRRQLRREMMKSEFSNSSRSRHSSGNSTSPSRRSRSRSSSNHRQPKTPEGRTASPKTRTSPKDRWEELLQRKSFREDGDAAMDELKPPFATIPAQNRKFAGSPAWDPSRRGSTEGRIQLPLPRGSRGKVMIPPLTPEVKRPSLDKIKNSPTLTSGQYRAVNKMADRTFKSPLGDPPGHYSPSQRSRKAPSTLTVIAPPTPTAKEKDTNLEGETGSSRTAALKIQLRQLEQENAMHASLRSASTKNTNNTSSHSRGNTGSSHTHRSSPSMHQRRQRTVETTTTTPRKSQSYGRSSSKDPTVQSSIHNLIPPISDGTEQKTGRNASPGKTRGSLYGANSRKKTWKNPPDDDDDDKDEIHLPPRPQPAGRTASSTTKELEQYLKSPRLPGDEKAYNNAHMAQTGVVSLDSIPASETTTES